MELALRQEAGLAKPDSDFAAVSGDNYLPRIQLMTSSSDKCKRGEFPINHYALISGQNYTDLSKEADVMVLSWHAKAMDMSGDEILVSFDPATELFKDIQHKADHTKDSGCMYGPEYLVYVPSLTKYASFFMGSKSARRESNNMHAQLELPATLKSQLVEWKTYSWQAPIVTSCSTKFDIPARESLIAAIKSFHADESRPAPEMAPEENQRAR